MSAFIFVMALEIFFVLIKIKVHIKGVNLYDHSFLLTAHANDSTFFRKDLSSVKMLVETFEEFFCFSELKLNTKLLFYVP